MARGKKSKSKPKGGSAKATRHMNRAPSKSYASQSWQAQEPTTEKFSLADEVRWMSNHRTAAFEAGNKLRYMPIQFISAGSLEGTIKEPDVELAPAALSPSSTTTTTTTTTTTPDNAAAMANMAIRSPSPTRSDASSSSSSADEVIFRGRGPMAPAAAAAKQPVSCGVADPKPPPSYAPQENTDFVTPQLTAASTAGNRASPTETEAEVSVQFSVRVNATSQVEHEVDSDADANDVVQDLFMKRRGGRPIWEGTTTPWQTRSKPNVGWLPGPARPDMDSYLRGHVNIRDLAMEDYMKNVEEFGLKDNIRATSGFARREMDLDAGSQNDWESASGSQTGGDQVQGEGSDIWDSDMLQDFDDMSTSSDLMDTVVRILSKRTRKSGLHYLCVYEGSVTDDARWLPSTFLNSPAEKLLVQAFEAEALEREQQMLMSSDSADADGDEDADEVSAEELDDETIARVLQKQEELGLGSDEVLLYAGDDFFDGPSAAQNSSGSYGRPNKMRSARVRGNREPSFPSASAMVDALEMDPYGGFDIMDTERPSLKPKKKARRGQPPPELEDSDLNEQLQESWAADRAKKRLKKAEREELREQGLLGRKGKSPNLKVKYQGGIVMEDVVEELREFLMGDMQTLSLPPMEAHRRATVHQAASSFNLTSRSRGAGLERFTVLSKTMRTRTYTDAEFDKQIQKKGFQKRLRGPLHTQGGRPARFSTVKHGARARPQLGYKDGETVGANAPELGPENKGHALMMKMGWSKGMGLGAGDNKGILQPIPHTIKTNKAGLQ
ncbi:hypothetical protein BDW02DRAFT_563600 [Decorospora gaudefroyi]|uniref:Protein SQS1 n=1 Tax=Decorospora gaudefroyi TaxID=184978 RepID=A0A6A5KXN2_9PLEO|nr:hypothetical protein BDW02DRAFT_563600 [Decorospora gaudefroyi]